MVRSAFSLSQGRCGIRREDRSVGTCKLLIYRSRSGKIRDVRILTARPGRVLRHPIPGRKAPGFSVMFRTKSATGAGIARVNLRCFRAYRRLRVSPAKGLFHPWLKWNSGRRIH
jgi:hypothetical protein